MKLRIIYWVLPIVLFVLIGMQVFWQLQIREKEQRDFHIRVLYALNKVRNKLRDENACVTLMNKPRVDSGQGLYLLRQSWNASGFYGPVDTLTLFLDTSGRAHPSELAQGFNAYKSSLPTFAEITLQIRYDGEPASQATDPLWNVPARASLDTALVRKEISNALVEEDIRTPFGFGFQDLKSKEILSIHQTKDSLKLIQSHYKIDVFRYDPFLSPMLLGLVFQETAFPFLSFTPALLSTALLIFLLLMIWQMQRYHKKQEELSAMKTDFMNTLHHEMNTPLTNIQLALESLPENDPPGELNKLHQIIASESTRLQQHIERSLQMARLEHGEWTLQKSSCDLYPLIFSVVERYRVSFGKEACQCTILDEIRPSIQADVFHLEQVFTNLLDNAIKYKSADRALQIRIRLHQLKGFPVISIRDNGMGMKPETRRHIFDKFFRAETGLIQKTRGFGLGLSYVRAILELHGAWIEVESTWAQGSEFHIHFLNDPLK